MRNLALRIICLTVTSFLVGSSMHTAGQAAPQACTGLFVSEYVEGSSNNKALEIFNGTGAAVDLAAEGYSVAIYFNGSSTPGTVIPLTGAVADGDVYVLADDDAAPVVLAVADQTDVANFFNGNDAVVLKRGPTVIDAIGQIGVDPGAAWGGGVTSTYDHTLRRKISVSAGDANPDDPYNPAAEWDGYPRDTFSGLGGHTATCAGGPPTTCGTPATPINVIQGSGAASPLVGTVVEVEALVAGEYQDPLTGFGGFYMTEDLADSDDDPNTSEGIFVYDDGFGVPVSVDGRVHVRGTVAEYQGLTELRSVTVVEVCDPPGVIGSTFINLPLSSGDAWERYEGMKVRFAQPLTVAEVYNLGRYGEVTLAQGGRPIQFTQTDAPDPAGYAAFQDELARRTILLDDGNLQQNRDPIVHPYPGLEARHTLRVGDTVQYLLAIVDYRYGSYRLQPESIIHFTASNPRPAPPPAAAGLRVASYNVYNFFNGDGLGGGFPTPRGASNLSELERQRPKIVNAILGLDADVVGLIEIENDAGPNGALADLVAALNAAAGGTVYGGIDTGVLGSDQIKLALIYQPAAVTPIGSWLTDSNAVWSRAPLAQTFQVNANGERFTVVVNHFKSKGCSGATGADVDQDDGQSCYNARRVQQAQRLGTWVAGTVVPAAGDPDVLLIGDYNSYAREDPIAVLETAGYSSVLPADHYSYVFEGLSGSLDYGLASASLLLSVTGASSWHIDADEPRVLDYNEEFKSPAQIVNLYTPDAYRSSDHDPLVVQVDLRTPLQVRAYLPMVVAR